MEILATTTSSDDHHYIRASAIYNICHTKTSEEFDDAFEELIIKMRYQQGGSHPTVIRTIRWYLKILTERGQQEKCALIEEKFAFTSN